MSRGQWVDLILRQTRWIGLFGGLRRRLRPFLTSRAIINPFPSLQRNQPLSINILITHIALRSFIQTNTTFLRSQITSHQPTSTSLPPVPQVHKLILASRTISPITGILTTIFNDPLAVLVASVRDLDGPCVFTPATGFGSW